MFSNNQMPSWSGQLFDDRFNTEETAVPCDRCEKTLSSEDSSWIQSNLDKTIWFCSEECQDSWLEETNN